ncbi:MAG: DUF4402 domain-containing protein [Ferruginibacter sp.]
MKSSRHFLFLCLLFMLPAGKTAFCQGLSDSTLNNAVVFRVNVVQPFQFGVYAQGASGGDIIISPMGVRSVTGTVIPLNFGATYNPLVLEVEAAKGSIVSVYSSGKNILTGSNGGKMVLRLGNMEPNSPFYIMKEPPQKTYINIGGVLSVGNAADSPPGNYSGNLYISFMVE